MGLKLLQFFDFLYFHNTVILGFLIVTPFAFLLRRRIREYSVRYYLGACIVMLVVVACYLRWAILNELPTNSWYFPLVTQFERGSVAFVLFTIVMFQGVIKPWNKATKQLFAIRGQLAILGCIMAFTHLAVQGSTYLFLSDLNDWAYTVTFAASSLLLVIGIPLFITSFKRIRFSMKAKIWKRLHRTAYLFYILLCMDVTLVFLRRLLFFQSQLDASIAYRVDTYISLLIYALITISYVILRFRTSLKKRRRARKHIHGTSAALTQPRLHRV